MGLETLRGLYAQKEYAAAVELYRTDPASVVAEWHLYGSLALMRSDEWYAAYTAIWRADELLAPPNVRCKVKFQYGYLARHIGDAGNALRQFGACLAGLDEAPELKSVLYGWTLFHKGVTLGYYPNRTEEALDCYLQAAAEFEDEGARDSLCHCLHNMAWLRLDTVDPALARELINQASPLCQDEHSTWRERVLLHYLAAVEGDFDEAQRLARWIEGEAPEDLRCLSLAIHANLCFDLGMTAPGMALANHAYDMAQNHQIDHRCYRVVLRALDRMNQARINTSGA